MCHPVKVWACGHTHWKFDFFEGPHPASVNGTRLVSNQRGYPQEPNVDYDPKGVVIHIRAPSKQFCKPVAN